MRRIVFLGIILLIMLWLFTSDVVFSTEQESKISNIVYSDNLSDTTIISIQGSNLDLCTNIKVNTKKIKILTRDTEKITYKFAHSNETTGVIYLTCDGDTLMQSFSFPYIDSIDGLDPINSNRDITIRWSSFWDNPWISIEEGWFSKNTANSRIIIWNISESTTWNELYVTADGLKSNIYSLGIPFPKIDFIVPEDNFSQNTQATIYWKNLDFKSIINYDWEKIANFKYNKNNGSLTFNLWYKLGEKTIKILSNWFLSNTLNINVYWNRSHIVNAYQANYTENEGVNQTALYIIAENLPIHDDDLDVYVNDSKRSIYKKKWNKIIILNPSLNQWDNFIHLWVSDLNSNTVNVNINTYKKLPYISSINTDTVKEWKRLVSVYIQNFEVSTDKIYFNSGLINPIGCSWNKCFVELPLSTITGDFRVWRDSYIETNKMFFDLSFYNTPYIKEVIFAWDLKWSTKFSIRWSHFKSANISGSNLFESIDDLIITDTLITGRLPFNYNRDQSSSISISHFWLTTWISFIGSELSTKNIRWWAIVKDLIWLEKNWLFKAWTEVRVSWKWLYSWDQVEIGGLITPLNFSNNTSWIWTFYIPDSIKQGNNSVIIRNIDGIKSNSTNIYIVSDDYKNGITLNSEKLDSHVFYMNSDTSTKELYKLSIQNKLQDFIVDKITFKVLDYKKTDYLGTFHLLLWWAKVWSAIVDKNWMIYFDKVFELNKWDADSMLTLIKGSDFIKTWDFKIIFSPDSLKMRDYYDKSKFDSFHYWDLWANYIEVKKSTEKSCVDAELDNGWCNAFFSDKKYTEKKEMKSTQVTNKVTTPVPSNWADLKVPPMKTEGYKYDTIDIKLDKAFEKISKKSYKQQLVIYKKLKSNLKKLLPKIKWKTKKELVIHISGKVNLQFKVIFKKYISEKKKN